MPHCLPGGTVSDGSFPPSPSGLPYGTGDRLLIDLPELHRLTSISVRHLRRLDGQGDIPGRVTCGRRVLFQLELIREWIRLGLPDRTTWQQLLNEGNSNGGASV